MQDRPPSAPERNILLPLCFFNTMKTEGLTPNKGAGLQEVDIVTFFSLLPLQLLLS